MSTKGTIILTEDNEHWYTDCNGAYNEKIKTEYCIVLEIDPRHKIETDDEGTRVIIEDGTPLHKALMDGFYGKKENREIVVAVDGQLYSIDDLEDAILSVNGRKQ